MITVNGNKMAWRNDLTLDKILKGIEENPTIVVVKVNGKPVLKKEYSTYKVPDHAEVVTIDIIAGG